MFRQQRENIQMKLKDWLPREFFNEYMDSSAAKYLEVDVVASHSSYSDTNYKSWCGPHKNVHAWCELSNGKLVGWNENPSRGWSFPVMTKK